MIKRKPAMPMPPPRCSTPDRLMPGRVDCGSLSEWHTMAEN